MTREEKNDLFYVCSLIEYIGRVTKNRRGAVVTQIGKAGIEKLLEDACVDHCLSFEQVSDEVIAQAHIQTGTYDTITDCPYRIPSYTDIGRLYSYLILHLAESGQEAEMLVRIFTSFLSDEISRFATGLYYETPSYLCESYKAGYLLE